MLRYFWDAVRATGSTGFRNSQEKYLLGTLLPVVRSSGGRQAFEDARPRKPQSAMRSRATEDLPHMRLEQLLQASAQERMTPNAFHDFTGGILLMPDPPPGFEKRYDELTSELLDAACNLLGQGDVDGAGASVAQQWDTLNARFGRHAGHELEKAVLNALSYEARAAMHHVYSLAWVAVIEHLMNRDNIDAVTQRFLQLWHTDGIQIEHEVSMFHSHVFALHPAASLFMQTTTGPVLLGDLLVAPDSVEAFERFLHGLSLAIHSYKDAIDEERRERKVKAVTGVDLEPSDEPGDLQFESDWSD